MAEFLRISSGFDALPILLELQRAPQLWDQHTTRTTFPDTPFEGTSDIWVRFRAASEIKSRVSHQEPHRSVWWPAAQFLPSLRSLVANLKARVDCTELGSVLITRLPPGRFIKPHSDSGAWAPEFYNCKAHVILQGTSESRCAAETITTNPGDIFTFDNLKIHSVNNNGPVDRIACIVSMRTEP